MAAALWVRGRGVRGRAPRRELERGQGARQLCHRPQDSRRGMAFLFCRVGSEGHVSGSDWHEKNSSRIASHSGQSERATLQWPGSNWNRSQAFSRPPVHHGLGAFASCPTELLSGWRRGAAIVAARRSPGPSVAWSISLEPAGPAWLVSELYSPNLSYLAQTR